MPPLIRFFVFGSNESDLRTRVETFIMKILLSLALIFFSVFTAVAQTARLSHKDLNPLEGGKWVGSLTYLDYSSGKSTSIKSDISVSKLSDRKWSFAFTYPDEPKANSKDNVILGDHGRTFDGETVVERTKLRDGVTRLVTSRAGKDNDKPATIRHTYLISKREFSIKKEVKLDSGGDYFERHIYSWRR